jgi:hypothetical protein
MVKSNKEGWIDWRTSAAREVIRNDLQPGGILHGRDNLPAKDVWELYRETPQFANVKYSQFRDRLSGHRKQYIAQQTKEPKKLKWIGSAAREIILADLRPPHGVLFGKDDVPLDQLWHFYEKQPGFELVKFEQFRDRLRDHRKQMTANYLLSSREEEILDVDRALHPRQSVNHRGELVFDMLPAQDFLRDDIEHGRHIDKTPSQIQASCPEYRVFKSHIFKFKVYQTIRRRKFLNYLEKKQLEKRSGIAERPKGSAIS